LSARQRLPPDPLLLDQPVSVHTRAYPRTARARMRSAILRRQGGPAPHPPSPTILTAGATGADSPFPRRFAISDPLGAEVCRWNHRDSHRDRVRPLSIDVFRTPTIRIRELERSVRGTKRGVGVPKEFERRRRW
jgi:hypothetical protein